MSKVISVAQKTFVDLYDSYVLNLSSDVIAVPCDQHGKILTTFEATISFSAKRGTKPVGSKYNKLIDPDTTTNELYHTVTKEAINIISINDNKIVFKFYKGKIFDDNFKIGIKFSTTDDNAFEFERYITFIKVKNGEKATTFKMYSVNGDTFKEGSDKITVKAVLFDGLTEVAISKCTWSYYNTTNTSFIEYKKNTTPTLDVYRDVRSGSGTTIFTMNDDTMVLKCAITYQGKSYEDYITLKKYHHTYDAVIKFFGGTNIFHATEPFVIAYLETYKDQQLDETIKAPYYYYHDKNTYDPTTGKYAFNGSNVQNKYKQEGTFMYMIYKIINGTEGSVAYKVRLYKYSGGQWTTPTKSEYINKYVYRCDMYEGSRYDTTATNVWVIAKEDVNKFKDIEFTVYKKVLDSNSNEITDPDLILNRNTATVFDLNDPVVGRTKPSYPKDGQLWLDTSNTPYLLYIYDEDSKTWEYFSQQNGKSVYVSQPSKYSQGDLWIVSEADAKKTNVPFSAGTMLISTQSSTTYNKAHWDDALIALAELQENMAQNFDFTATNGLIISRNQKKFYVQITSEEMGFYSNGKKEVWIGNNTTNIDNVTIEDKATFDCKNGVVFNSNTDIVGSSLNIYQNTKQEHGFSFKIESNGSFSLVLAE